MSRFSRLKKLSTLLPLLMLPSCAGIQISAIPPPTRPPECDRFEIVHTSPGTLKGADGQPLADGALWTIEIKQAPTVGIVRKLVGDTTETKFEVMRNNAGWHALCDVKVPGSQ